MSNYAALEVMFMDNDPVDQIETRFHEMVGDLKSERSRILAGIFFLNLYQYLFFCR